MKRKIMKKSYLSLTPSCNGFKGKIIKIDNKNYLSKGKYEIINDVTLRITELPIGKWTDDYKEFLDSLLIEKGERKKQKNQESRSKKRVERRSWV